MENSLNSVGLQPSPVNSGIYEESLARQPFSLDWWKTALPPRQSIQTRVFLNTWSAHPEPSSVMRAGHQVASTHHVGDELNRRSCQTFSRHALKGETRRAQPEKHGVVMAVSCHPPWLACRSIANIAVIATVLVEDRSYHYLSCRQSKKIRQVIRQR